MKMRSHFGMGWCRGESNPGELVYRDPSVLITKNHYAVVQQDFNHNLKSLIRCKIANTLQLSALHYAALHCPCPRLNQASPTLHCSSYEEIHSENQKTGLPTCPPPPFFVSPPLCIIIPQGAGAEFCCVTTICFSLLVSGKHTGNRTQENIILHIYFSFIEKGQCAVPFTQV